MLIIYSKLQSRNFALQGYLKNQINLRVLWKYCHLIDDKSSVCGEERAKEGEKEDVRNNDTENMMKCDIANMKVLSLVPYQFKTMLLCVCACVHVCMCMHVCMCVSVFVTCPWVCLYACMNACTHAFVTFSRMLFLPCYSVYLLL